MPHARVVIAKVLAVLLGVLSCAVPAGAQELTMTLLPVLAQRVESTNPQGSYARDDLVLAADAGSNPTKLVYLRFSLAAVPAGATITGGTVRLTVLDATKPWQAVRVLPVTFAGKLETAPPPAVTWSTRPSPDGPQGIGLPWRAVTSAPQSRTVDVPLVVPEKGNWVKRDRAEVALMLRSPSPNAQITFRGLCAPETATTPACANAQPRLIVRYRLPDATRSIPWPQARYDAQQSGRTPWRLSGRDVVKSVSHRLVYAVPGHISLAPVAAERTFVLYTQRDDKGSATFFLTAVDETGRERWAVDIQAAAKFSPMLDRRGRVWVVSENALHRIEIGAEGPSRVSYQLATLLGTKSASAQAAPTLGASGAMYLSTDQGLFALALDPEPRVLWALAQAPLGQAALSADEATAFAVSGTRPRALVAIDTADGRVRWSAGRIDTEPESDDKLLPVPVVGTAPDDTKRPRPAVYVVSGYERGRSLHFFDGDTGRTVVRTAEYYSRPVVASTGRVVVVRKQPGQPGQLCRFIWASAWDEKKATIVEWCQQKPPESLSSLSVLAVDGDNNLYVIDPTTDKDNPAQKVRGYTYDYVRLFALDVPRTPAPPPPPAPPGPPSTNFDRNLLVGPGGTLVLANANALFAIEPKALRDSAPADLTLKGDALQKTNETSFLARRRITVNGDVTVAAHQSFVLRSGQIAFQPGFKILKGAELSCKTSSPSE